MNEQNNKRLKRLKEMRMQCDHNIFNTQKMIAIGTRNLVLSSTDDELNQLVVDVPSSLSKEILSIIYKRLSIVRLNLIDDIENLEKVILQSSGDFTKPGIDVVSQHGFFDIMCSRQNENLYLVVQDGEQIIAYYRHNVKGMVKTDSYEPKDINDAIRWLRVNYFKVCYNMTDAFIPMLAQMIKYTIAAENGLYYGVILTKDPKKADIYAVESFKTSEEAIRWVTEYDDTRVG